MIYSTYLDPHVIHGPSNFVINSWKVGYLLNLYILEYMLILLNMLTIWKYIMHSITFVRRTGFTPILSLKGCYFFFVLLKNSPKACSLFIFNYICKRLEKGIIMISIIIFIAIIVITFFIIVFVFIFIYYLFYLFYLIYFYLFVSCI